MHGLAVVTQRLLREPFRIADDPGAFNPGAVVTAQRHAGEAKLTATRGEPGGAGAGAHARQLGELNTMAIPPSD